MAKDYVIKNRTLYHHGIQGQKWGVRRYQNPDGSLTAAGREHYGYGEAKANVKTAKKAYKQARRESTISGIRYANRVTNPFANITKKQKEKTKLLENKAWDDYNKELKAKSAYQKSKNEAYKTKLINKASNKAQKLNRMADEDAAAAKNIKKEGSSSKEYQRYLKSKLDYYDTDYMSDDYTFDDNFKREIAQVAVLGKEKLKEKVVLNQMYNDYVSSSKEYRSYGEKWTERASNLMNMPISDTTSKKDIKKVYRGG